MTFNWTHMCKPTLPVKSQPSQTHTDLRPIIKEFAIKPMDHPVVVLSEGPHAGLYVQLNGQVAYVKGETRPYAAPFRTIIHDSVNGTVFYTSSPHTLVANPAYTVASQPLQDEYAYFYRGNMPYCNGVVHEITNRMTTDYIILTQLQLQKRCRPMTPQTAQRLQRSVTPVNARAASRQLPVFNKTPVQEELDEEWLEKLNIDDLLQEFKEHIVGPVA